MALTDYPPESYRPDLCPGWLLDGLETMVYRSPVAAKRQAELMGCSVDLLYAYATAPDNPSRKHAHLPAYRLVPLTFASQNYALLDAIEANVGRVSTTVVPRTDKTLTQLITDSIQSMCQLIQHESTALADGQVTLAEAKGLRADISRLRECLNRLEVEMSLREAEGGNYGQ